MGLLQAGKYMGGSVVLTFDDACRSVLTIAAPILLEHGFPATIFTVTGALQGGNEACRGSLRGQPMTADEAREVQALGYLVHPHGEWQNLRSLLRQKRQTALTLP